MSKTRIDWIVSQVQSGKLRLPEPEEVEDTDYTMIWALADSGLPAHVADCRKILAGATIRQSEGQTNGVQFQPASGASIPNRGEAEIVYFTPDGQRRRTVFQDAAVGMAILSINKIAEEDNLVAFHKRGEYIWHIPTNIHKAGKEIGVVHFVQLKVPRALATEGVGRPEP